VVVFTVTTVIWNCDGKDCYGRDNSAFRYWFHVLQKFFLKVNYVHCYREQRFIFAWRLKCCSRWTEEFLLCLVKTLIKGTNAFYFNFNLLFFCNINGTQLQSFTVTIVKVVREWPLYVFEVISVSQETDTNYYILNQRRDMLQYLLCSNGINLEIGFNFGTLPTISVESSPALGRIRIYHDKSSVNFDVVPKITIICNGHDRIDLEYNRILFPSTSHRGILHQLWTVSVTLAIEIILLFRRLPVDIILVFNPIFRPLSCLLKTFSYKFHRFA
jgi:hypothetical protein